MTISSTKRVLRRASGALVSAACLIAAGTSQAQISFSDDFQSQTVGQGVTGWTTFINAFDAACSAYLGGYGYDQTATNNGGIVAADTGTSIVGNVYADYANGDLATPICMETNVFRQFTIASGDAGDYEFTADHEPGSAPGADTELFITIFPPDFSSTLATATAPTTGAAGSATVALTIPTGNEGNILQVGFRTTQTGYADSGRFYDNATFGLASTGGGGSGGGTGGGGTGGGGSSTVDPNQIPVLPLWALALLAGAAGLFGARKLRK